MQHRSRLRPRAAIVSSTIAAAGAIGLAVLSAAPAQAAPTATSVSIDAPATATVGTPVDVTVALRATTDVHAYEITLDTDGSTLVDGSVSGPAGGFDTAQQDGDVVTLLHTRLGTSPSLDGDLEAAVVLTPTAVGSADLRVTSVTLVDDDGATTVLTDPASTAVTVTAAATAAPTPGATSTPEPGTDPGDPTDPTDPTDPGDPAATTTPSTDATSVAAPGGDRPAGGALAWTGADVAPWIAASLALLAAGGTLITVRARRARRERTGAAE